MTIHAPPEAMPASVDAEQSLLGAMLVSKSCIPAVALILEPEHFSESLHAAIYRRIVEAANAGHPTGPKMIAAGLSDLEMPEGITISGYLARLSIEASSIQDAPAWATMIRDMAHRRELTGAARELAADAMGAAITTAGVDILDRFSDRVKHIAETRAVPVEGSDALAWRIVEEIEKARAGEFTPDTFTTGFPRLDETARYRPGDVIVTAGRPGQGKSIFAACTARRLAESGLGVLEFPFEIGREQAICRHLSDLAYQSRSPICFSWILDRAVHSPALSDRIGAAVQRLNQLPIEIDDAERLTVSRIAARVRQEKAKMAARGVRLALVSLDHLDFIQASDRYAGNRTQEIGEIMIGLKAIARRENVAVHVFSQLNRSVETRDDKRPTLSDLRNSGDIEQVADIVQFLYRDAYYLAMQVNGDPEKEIELEAAQNVLEVIRAKVRSGKTGHIRLFVDVGASYIDGRA
jgi:replicative DNA helicase